MLNRDKELAERATLVKQEELIKGKRVFRLADLWIRPGLGTQGRKMSGILEVHQNGFRYYAPKGVNLDVMYRSVWLCCFGLTVLCVEIFVTHSSSQLQRSC